MTEHFVQFYENDAFLVEEVSGFISEGLKGGEAAVVIASREHRDSLTLSLAAHLARRRSAGQKRNTSRTRGSGPYVALDAEETLALFMVDGWPSESRFMQHVGSVLRKAAQAGNGRVRLFGEMVALLWQAGQRDAAVRLEDLWNELGKRHAFSLFCAYPMQAFSSPEDGKRLMAVCNAHTRVQPTETFNSPAATTGELNRIIVQLQHKTAALEAEAGRRAEIEKSLKRRESELSDFLENAVEGVHRVGADGTILWANRAEMEMLGYGPGEYIGRRLTEFHSDRAAGEGLLKRLVRGETLSDEPARLRCRDGSVKHVRINSNALFENGRFIHSRCFTRDVTDAVRLQDELGRRLEQLAEADRRKDEFLAMLGHELRSPLAPVANALELLRLDPGVPSRVEQARATIERQIGIMKRVVDDLLDMSRMASGKIELRREKVLLRDVVECALEMARPLVDEKRHTLSLDLPPQPVIIEGDGMRLGQVLANVLHNAAKYTDAGGRIMLSARCEGAELRLAVRDNGIGLDPGLREEMFQLFVQGRDSLARSRGGLGIGLTLVRKIVELHGGRVEARSDGPGCGTELVIRLALPANAAAGLARGPRGTGEEGARAHKILVVDDNVDAAETLAEWLRLLKHHVSTAHDAHTAIERAMLERPDLLILDIGLPDVDGYELARRLRAVPQLRSTVFVALTGYAQESDVARSRQSGFDHHFSKPLDMPRLAALLAGPGKGRRRAVGGSQRSAGLAPASRAAD